MLGEILTWYGKNGYYAPYVSTKLMSESEKQCIYKQFDTRNYKDICKFFPWPLTKPTFVLWRYLGEVLCLTVPGIWPFRCTLDAKAALTADFQKEAAVYFHIGENNIRNIINQNPDADFWFWNGNRKQIKRKLFEQYMDLQKLV